MVSYIESLNLRRKVCEVPIRIISALEPGSEPNLFVKDEQLDVIQLPIDLHGVNTLVACDDLF